ncbi:MAG: carbohydrate-binding protein [Oscillospiraceae bacterium]|nr:carbohydrate-binding protein [Oscillospiraceae bacterium]
MKIFGNIKRLFSVVTAVAILAGTVSMAGIARTVIVTEHEEWDEIESIIGRYNGEWHSTANAGSVRGHMPSTALMGNGDIAVSSAGNAEEKTFHVSKSDFWTADQSNPSAARPIPIGGITLRSTEPAPLPKSGGNIAPLGTATATSNHPDFPPQRALAASYEQGSEGWVSRHRGESAPWPPHLIVEFEEPMTITKWAVHSDAAARGPSSDPGTSRDFELQTSDTGADPWTTVSSVTGNNLAIREIELEEPVTSQFFRLLLTIPMQNADDAFARARVRQLQLIAPSDGEEDENPNDEDIIDPDEYFYEKQDILNAKVDTELVLGNRMLEMETWTTANDHKGRNYIISKITSTDTKEASLQVEVWAGSPNNTNNGTYPRTAAHSEDSSVTVSRYTAAPSGAFIPPPWRSRGVLSSKIIGKEFTTSSDNASKSFMNFTLEPNETVYVVTAVAGGGQVYTGSSTPTLKQGQTEPLDQAHSLLNAVSGVPYIDGLIEDHAAWWKDFWSTSYVNIDLPQNDSQKNDQLGQDIALLQQYYYGGQYVLGCSVKEGYIAPGLYGHWITTDNPSWNNDYHLNYNFVSPFYGVASSNRPETLLPAVEAALSHMIQGERNAMSPAELTKIGLRRWPDWLIAHNTYTSDRLAAGTLPQGIPDSMLFPVGIGPWGSFPDISYHNSTVHVPFSAYPMVEYYKYTKDAEFFVREFEFDFFENYGPAYAGRTTTTVYEYLRKCANFLEAWVEKEDFDDGTYRYNLVAAYNEGSWAKNAAVELGAYKMSLEALLLAIDLNDIEDPKRDIYQDLYDNLAPFATTELNGKEIFPLAEYEWIPSIPEYRGSRNPRRENETQSDYEAREKAEYTAEFHSNTERTWDWGPLINPFPESNPMQLEPIFPFNRLGYYSHPDQIKIAHNTIEAVNSWNNNNAYPKIYTIAPRVRYNPSVILTGLARRYREQVQPNLWNYDGVHGIEKSGATGGINVMMLIGDKGYVKAFPNWPEGRAAEFTRLRAEGAFIVSSKYDGSSVTHLEVTSEAGGTLNMISPWLGGMSVTRASDGADVAVVKSSVPDWEMEDAFSFETTAGETYIFTEVEGDLNPVDLRSFLRTDVNNIFHEYYLELTNAPKADLQIGNAYGGAFVEAVQDGGFGQYIGLAENDVITEISGTFIESTAKLIELYDALTVGDDVTLKVWRADKYIEITFAKPEKHGGLMIPRIIQAESFDLSNARQDGPNIRPTIANNSDISPYGTGRQIGNIGGNDWVMYKDINFSEPIESMLFRVSKDGGLANTTTISVRIGENTAAAQIATAVVTGHPDLTGGEAWNTYRTIAATVTNANITGVHDLYLHFSNSVNVNWFSINDAEPSAPPAITTESLPSVVVDSPYSQSLSADGEQIITWSRTGGTLPPGLILGTNGTISGTPTEEGTYSFTVRAYNGGGTDTKTLSITIRSPIRQDGDANGDDVVDIHDILMIRNHILGTPRIEDPDDLKAADVNKDGVINIFDMLTVRDIILRK